MYLYIPQGPGLSHAGEAEVIALYCAVSHPGQCQHSINILLGAAGERGDTVSHSSREFSSFDMQLAMFAQTGGSVVVCYDCVCVCVS